MKQQIQAISLLNFNDDSNFAKIITLIYNRESNPKKLQNCNIRFKMKMTVQYYKVYMESANEQRTDKSIHI